MKVYARQVEPKWQESPLYLCGIFPENIAVYGNPDYYEHCPEVFARVRECLDGGELWEAVEQIEDGEGSYAENYGTVADAVADMLPPEKTAAYSASDVEALKAFVMQYPTDETIAAVLSVVTGEEWETETICGGCCQREWQKICYPAEKWTKEDIERFEKEYFNTGTEWMVAEEGGDGLEYSCYCYSEDTEGVRQEIADASGTSPAEVALFEFSGYVEKAQYREV